MEKSLYLAGVGGQGLQVAGKAVVEAAMGLGYNVTYSPKYGPAKRGGLTSCYLVISDEEIGNPRKKRHDIMLVMEPMAYAQFKNDVKDGGLLLVNSSLVKEQEAPGGNFRRLDVPMYDVCFELQNTKVISSVVLGVLAALLTDVFPDSGLLLSQMLEKLKNKASLVELNHSAFEKGFALVRPGGNE